MRRLFMAIAVVVALVVIGGLLAGPTFTPGEIPGQATPAPEATRASQPTPSPQVTPVDASKLATAPRAIVLLNPLVATPGSSVSLTGSGYDPGATVDLTLKRNESDKGRDLGFAQADQGGNIGASFTVPGDFTGSYILVARQHDGKKQAQVVGQLRSTNPTVKLGTQVGKVGDVIAVSGAGFAPKEKVRVYFNSLGSDPVAELQSDDRGSLGRASLKIPYGAAGDNSFIFVGEKSQSPVAVNFLMLSLYPSVGLSSYAIKADNVITFSGEGFGPREKVRVHLNSLDSPPISEFETDDKGSFKNAGGFLVPFELKGKNMLILVGERSQVAITAGFDVLPYTPTADPSTYGGRPGTSLTFYGTGFARGEIVRVYMGRTRDSKGKEVLCFKTDDQGSIVAGPTYTIPANARPGQLTFALTGDRSQATATVTIEVMAASGPVQAPAEEPAYVCPYDQGQR